MILGEHVTTDAGTGAVHTAPDHGLDDFYVGLRYGIGTLNLLDEHGVFTAGAGQFAGDHVYKVDEKVIGVLEQVQALVRSRLFITAMRTAGGQKHRLSTVRHRSGSSA